MGNVSTFLFPELLVGQYDDFKMMRNSIIYGSYLSLDKVVPMLRNRGTVIRKQKELGKFELMGWQRDITRMRKHDVSLSFIIYMTILEDGRVGKVSIDDSFNGGKGVLCSKTYLEKVLKDKLEGNVFHPKTASVLRLNQLKCFHVHEIMSSLYSTYFLYQEGAAGDGNGFYEEDTIDVYCEGGALMLSGIQRYKNKKEIKYMLCFYDIFNHITFDREGYMKLKGKIKVAFYINEERIITDELYQSENDTIFIKFQKYAFACGNKMQQYLVPGYKHKLMNTNLYPSALIGAVMQAVGIRVFRDNFNYIQFIMTAMQRPGKKPGCIGAILDELEAEKYFEGFDINKIT